MAQDSFARAVATASLDNTSTLDTRLTAVEESVAAGLKRVIVQQLPTEHISTTTIYMVPKSVVKPQQGYDEFMYINNAWEKIGDTEVDLTDYAQKTWVEGKGYITAASLTGKLDKGTTTDLSEHIYTFDRDGQKTDKTLLDNVSLASSDNQIPTALAVKTALNSKQSAMSAGANIQINNNVISATDTTYTAGTNITIDANNVISATGGSTPENMVTTDTVQTLTAQKVVSSLKFRTTSTDIQNANGNSILASNNTNTFVGNNDGGASGGTIIRGIVQPRWHNGSAVKNLATEDQITTVVANPSTTTGTLTGITIGSTSYAVGGGEVLVDDSTVRKNAFGFLETTAGGGMNDKQYLASYSLSWVNVTPFQPITMTSLHNFPPFQYEGRVGLSIMYKQNGNAIQYERRANLTEVESGVWSTQFSEGPNQLFDITIEQDTEAVTLVVTDSDITQVKMVQLYSSFDAPATPFDPSLIPIDYDSVRINNRGEINVPLDTLQFERADSISSYLGYKYGPTGQVNSFFTFDSTDNVNIDPGSGICTIQVAQAKISTLADSFTPGNTYTFTWGINHPQIGSGTITAQCFCESIDDNFITFSVTSQSSTEGAFSILSSSFNLGVNSQSESYRCYGVALSAQASQGSLTAASIGEPVYDFTTKVNAKALPAGAPTGADGTYVLKATKAGSTITYSWVAE